MSATAADSMILRAVSVAGVGKPDLEAPVGRFDNHRPAAGTPQHVRETAATDRQHVAAFRQVIERARHKNYLLTRRPLADAFHLPFRAYLAGQPRVFHRGPQFDVAAVAEPASTRPIPTS